MEDYKLSVKPTVTNTVYLSVIGKKPILSSWAPCLWPVQGYVAGGKGQMQLTGSILVKKTRRSWWICASPSLRVACHIEDVSQGIDGSRSEIQLSKKQRDGTGARAADSSHERRRREANRGMGHSEAGVRHSRCARALWIPDKPWSPHREQVSDQVSCKLTTAKDNTGRKRNFLA